MRATDGGYWLFGRKADLGWFVWSLLIPLAVYLPPYAIWGSKAVWPLYLLYVVGFATPHTWLTYAVSLPRTARGLYDARSFWHPLIATSAIAVLVPFSQWYGGWDALFTAVTLLGFYHIGKQHLGILRMYDAKYAQVHDDRSIFATMQPFHALWVLAFTLPVFYVWLSPSLHVVVDRQAFTLLSPGLPAWSLLPLLAAMAWYGWQTVRHLWTRHRQGLPLPTAHLVSALTSGLSYLIAFAVVRPEDYLLTLAIFISFHDLQYFGFVWHFQRQRSVRLAAAGVELDAIHRWAHADQWGRYFGLAFGFSLALVALLSAVPTTVALTIVVFHNTLHYLMDGWIWKRQNHATLSQDLGLAAR
jgi:hypothetical protein